MSEVLKEKKREKGKWYIREWKPTEWRPATEDEIRELNLEDPFFEFRENIKRFRRFMKKIDEAFQVLFEG